MIHQVITQWEGKAPIEQLCRVLQVSRSGYYAARAKRPSATCLDSVRLQAAFEASGHCYGSRRLSAALNAQGHQLGRYRVRTLMKRLHLKPRWKRKFVHTTDSKHNLPIAPNVLQRQFSPGAANEAWVSDLTYIRTASGWLYLAAVMDLYSRKIVGWAMSASMPAQLVCQALDMAIGSRKPAPGLLIHSDRGCQYASAEYTRFVNQHGFVASMSGKGNCWDNAVMERFFLNLKMERVWQNQYANHSEARKDIADYIVNFYNSTRLHSTLNYKSPMQFESTPQTTEL